jgi:hypothetical protein
MAYNGSGTFNRVHNWATDKTNLVPVTASRMDTEMDGMATGLSTAICKDGQTATSARIPFAAGVSAMSGAVGGVSYAHANDANTGMYFPAADQVGLAAGGVATLTSTATTVTVPVAAAVTGALTVTGVLTAAEAAKCWAYVTVSGGTPTLQASNNITSITDTDVGELTITIATDFSSVNWVSLATSNLQHTLSSFSSKTAGSANIQTFDDHINTPADPAAYNFAGFGAQ